MGNHLSSSKFILYITFFLGNPELIYTFAYVNPGEIFIINIGVRIPVES